MKIKTKIWSLISDTDGGIEVEIEVDIPIRACTQVVNELIKSGPALTEWTQWHFEQCFFVGEKADEYARDWHKQHVETMQSQHLFYRSNNVLERHAFVQVSDVIPGLTKLVPDNNKILIDWQNHD